VPILEEVLFRDIGLYLRNHPKAGDPEAGLWPGKVPGHNKLSYDREFDPKGFYRYTFKPACERSGLAGPHFHELRHTFATLALENDMSMFDLSRAMGHETQAVTDRVYGHLRREDHSALRARVSAYVAAAVAPITAIHAVGHEGLTADRHFVAS
jgi:integrase